MKTSALVMALMMVLLSTAALAEVPGLISYQGTLRDTDDNPAQGTYDMVVEIYDNAAATGAALWTETHNDVEVREGHFNLLLGESSAINPTLFRSPDRYVQLTVDGMEMVYVPEGRFEMGLEDPDGLSRNHALDLRPPQFVSLDAYWIDRTEVTNGMYGLCVAEGVCEAPIRPVYTTRDVYFGDPAYAAHPVLGVLWESARAYCEWAGRRLPTEAEWEKAARSWDGRMFPWGNEEPDCTRANFYNGSFCVGWTSPVGSYPAAPATLDLYDMAGNVWEWCNDWWICDLGTDPQTDPPGPGAGSSRVFRGGSWYGSVGDHVRCAYRGYSFPSFAYSNCGIRCARSQ